MFLRVGIPSHHQRRIKNMSAPNLGSPRKGIDRRVHFPTSSAHWSEVLDVTFRAGVLCVLRIQYYSDGHPAGAFMITISRPDLKLFECVIIVQCGQTLCGQKVLFVIQAIAQFNVAEQMFCTYFGLLFFKPNLAPSSQTQKVERFLFHYLYVMNFWSRLNFY